jgi:very-short-patch-repair endonuclease
MELARSIPDRLLLAASTGRATRIVGYRAAAWVYSLDGVPSLVPEFAVPHGAWHRTQWDHQRRRIDDLEVVEIHGVLVTSIRQTLADLCAVVHLDVVERAVESALRLQLVTEPALRDFAALFTFSRHGAPGLWQVLDRRPIGCSPTGSDLETICLQSFRAGGVRAPERQFPILHSDGELVALADFGFPPTRFIVETDGLETHKTPEQQQYDSNRQNRICDAGYSLRRFTYSDVVDRPAYLCRETRRGLLAATTSTSTRAL